MKISLPPIVNYTNYQRQNIHAIKPLAYDCFERTTNVSFGTTTNNTESPKSLSKSDKALLEAFLGQTPTDEEETLYIANKNVLYKYKSFKDIKNLEKFIIERVAAICTKGGIEIAANSETDEPKLNPQIEILIKKIIELIKKGLSKEEILAFIEEPIKKGDSKEKIQEYIKGLSKEEILAFIEKKHSDVNSAKDEAALKVFFRQNPTGEEKALYKRNKEILDKQASHHNSPLKDYKEITAAICTIVGLNLEESNNLTHLIKIVNKYQKTLPIEEAIICTKGNFSDKEIQAYIKLREQELKCLQDKAVRDNGSKLKISPELALLIVKILSDFMNKRYSTCGTKNSELYNSAVNIITNQLLTSENCNVDKKSKQTSYKLIKTTSLDPEGQPIYFLRDTSGKEKDIILTFAQSLDYKKATTEYNLDSEQAKEYALNPEKQKSYYANGKRLYPNAPEVLIEEYSNFDETKSNFADYLVTETGLSPRQVLELFTISPDIIDRTETIKHLYSDSWYNIGTGENEEVHDVIIEAIKRIKENSTEISQITTESITSDDIKNNNLPLKIERGKLNLDCQGCKSKQLQKTMKDGKPVLIVKVSNSIYFVAYRGAVAHVNFNDNKYDDLKLAEDIRPHCNLSKYNQPEILVRAIKELPFDINDGNGGCIISKGLVGIDALTGKNETDKDTKKYFIEHISDLDKNGEFNAQNMLRLFPKDAVLSINPYITADNMLYSISAEWSSKDNTKWQMRIHSADLKYPNQGQWIARIGYTDNNDIKHFLEWEFYLGDKECYFGNDNYHSNDSHIIIASPVKNNLLNNINFQNAIRKLSKHLYFSEKMKELASEYPDIQEPKDYDEKVKTIIDAARKNPIFYHQEKLFVDELRKEQNLLDLTAI